MSFTFEMDIGKGVLVIDIYNFICAKQNDIDGAVLILHSDAIMLSLIHSGLLRI